MTPLEALSLYATLRGQRAELIRAAREAGHTWQEIADAAGMSRAMVHRVAQTSD